jgi:predicted DCC family thiol-disulfide oxidoreductase YuxK
MPTVEELPMTRAQEKLLIIFDGSCDFCTATVQTIQRCDWRDIFRFAPFQQSGLPEQHGLTIAQCEQAVWIVMPDGHKFAGAHAVSSILDAILILPLFSTLYQLPPLAHIADALYAWVARNRSHFPGVTPYCQRPGAQCGATQ